jgi:hypothetical protein
MDGLHMVLDVLGMTPIGPIADAINSVIYLVEGDWKDAGLSILSALPIVGDVLGGAKIGAKYGDDVLNVINYLKGYLRQNGLYNKLEKVYQSVTAIPWLKPKSKKNVDEVVDLGKGTGNSIGNGKQYSTLYEASTGNGASRSAHRNAANKEFYNQMANDAQFKKAMDDSFGYDVMGHMKSGKSALKNPSKDWAWHHPADTPGVVRLVPKNQHQSPLLQDVLHPGPNGQGGFGLFK